MKVYEALAEAFVKEGTSDVFGMMGDANMHWMAALADRGVQLYEVRHEGSGLGMADGWARGAERRAWSPRPAVPASRSWPPRCSARAGRVPPGRLLRGDPLGDEGATQYLDQRRFAAAIECEFIHVTRPENAQEAVRQAFYLARTKSKPVMISAPFDVQLAELDDYDEDYVPSTALIEKPRLLPDPARVQAACDLIQDAKRVVIIAGRGARKAEAGEEVLALQERAGALLATTLQAKNWLCDRTDFHVGLSGLFGDKVSMELLQEADCVIAVGASLNHYTIESGYLYPEAKYIQIDTAPHLVMGNGKVADCYLQADAVTALNELTRELQGRSVQLEGFHTDQVQQHLTARVQQPEYVSEPGRLDPREAIWILDHELPGEMGLVLGSGHQTDFGTMLFQRSRDVLSNYGMFGAIGQAPLIALGQMIAQGNKPGFVVEGDASFIMHLSEFETACRYDVPLLVVVMNDQGLGAEYHKAKAKGLDPELATISTPELGTVAQALGGGGATVRTAQELRDALAEYVRAPRPTVVDVRITRQVLSTPYRRIQYGEDV